MSLSIRIPRGSLHLLLTALFGVSGRAQVENADEDRLWIEAVFQRLVQWEGQNGIPSSAPLGDLVTINKRKHPHYPDSETSTYVYSSRLRVNLYSQSGRRILSLTRLPREVNDFGVVAKWSEAKAVELAKQAVAILMGELPERMGKPQVEFRPAKLPGKASPATWRVFWPRATRDGYEWITEGIQITLSEERGVQSFGDDRWTHFEEPPVGAKVKDAAELEAKAWEMARATVKARIFKAFATDAEVERLVSGQLQVIWKNSFLTQSSIDAVWENIKKERQAAIAWVFRFEWKKPGAARIGGRLLVYIDPFTGEYLGGDST